MKQEWGGARCLPKQVLVFALPDISQARCKISTLKCKRRENELIKVTSDRGSAYTEVISVWTPLQDDALKTCLCYQGLPAPWTRGKRHWRAFNARTYVYLRVFSLCALRARGFYNVAVIWGWLWCRLRVCVMRQRALGDAAVTSNRLLHASEWKCVISRFMLPFRSPSSPASHPTFKMLCVCVCVS